MEPSGSAMDGELLAPSWDRDASTYASMDIDPKFGNLCEFCDKLDFSVLGYQEIDPPRQRLWVDVGEIVKNAEGVGCVICGKVVKVFEQWKTQNFVPSDPNHLRTTCKACFFTSSLLAPTRLYGRPVRLIVEMYIRYGNPTDDRLVLQFQKCSQPPLEHLDWERGEEQPFNGRIREQRVDTKLFLKWISTCCEKHRGCKPSAHIMTPPDMLRLIDVKDRCLVVKYGHEVEDCRFAALSYVWGEQTLEVDKEMPKLKSDNMDFFLESKSLTRVKVPATIDDAMTLVAQLGEQYLWVDCLCIMQDDVDDQEHFINVMNCIYGLAFVTIVAASGNNADAGLPGVQKDRTMQEVITVKNNISLLQTLDPMETNGDYYEYQYVGESTWNTRGWTLQEKIFSLRTLIFTKEQVYWECWTTAWCEDVFWETKQSLFSKFSQHVSDLRFPFRRSDDPFDFLNQYVTLVKEYTGRQLTKEKDGLNAFKGVLNALEIGSGCDEKQEFLWGLPLRFLGEALMWEPHYSQRLYNNQLKMRDAKHPISKDLSCSFPSWSWVGWVGKVLFRFRLDAKWDQMDLHIYYIDAQNILQKVINFNRSLIKKSSWNPIRPGYGKIDVDINDRQVQKVISKSVASNMLLFWSSAIKVNIHYTRYKRSSLIRISFCPIISKRACTIVVEDEIQSPPIPTKFKGSDFYIIDGDKKDINDIDEEEKEEFELIVIGSRSPEEYEQSKGYCCIVLVCSVKDGIAYRKGLVVIRILEWMKCGPKWKFICLG